MALFASAASDPVSSDGAFCGIVSIPIRGPRREAGYGSTCLRSLRALVVGGVLSVECLPWKGPKGGIWGHWDSAFGIWRWPGFSLQRTACGPSASSVSFHRILDLAPRWFSEGRADDRGCPSHCSGQLFPWACRAVMDARSREMDRDLTCCRHDWSTIIPQESLLFCRDFSISRACSLLCSA
jgi:hypothetical protein